MKTVVLAIIPTVLVLLISCESNSNNFPPPVTERMARKSGTLATVDALNHGRRIFASRCIECHVLPPISKYPADRWPKIVNWMGSRASLKPEDREAVIAYVLAVRRAPAEERGSAVRPHQ